MSGASRTRPTPGLRARLSPLWAPLAVVAILSGSWHAAAQYPGINGRIAFVRATEHGGPDIWTADADGSDFVKVTLESGNYGPLDWSPDGTRIAYEVFDDEKTEIWVMNADGSDAHRVSPPDVTRRNPSWSPDGRYLAVDDGNSIFRIDTIAGHEQIIKEREVDTTVYECGGELYMFDKFYSWPSWSPDGARIAMTVATDMPPVSVGFGCDFNPFVKSDLAVIPSGGGTMEMLTDDPANASERFDGLADWSPDGSKIVFQRGTGSSVFGVAVISGGGGPVTMLSTGSGGRPRWSPDGSKILYTRDQNGDGNNELWTMDAADGTGKTPVLQDAGNNFYQDWQPILAPGLEVTLDAFTPDGLPIGDRISLSQTVLVEMRIENTGSSKLSKFQFAEGTPLVIDTRSTGELLLAEGSQPPLDPKLTLEPDESVTYTFEVSTLSEGIAAAHTKVRAKNEDGAAAEDVHSLRFDIADGAELTDALGRYVLLQAVDQLLQKSFRSWMTGMAARGNALADRMRQYMTPEQQQQWFGAATGLVLSPADFALGMLRGVAPEMVAALQPKNTYQGHTAEELDRVYNAAFKEELKKGVAQYVSNWAELGGDAKKALEDSWAEVMLTSFVLLGNATPEERLQYAAYSNALLDGIDSSSVNLYNTIATELPMWRENLTYLNEAVDLAVADAFLLSPDLVAATQDEAKWRENVLATAPNDPVGFQRAWAGRDGEIASLGIPLVFDTLVGGGTFKFGGALKDVVAESKLVSMMRVGRATGVIDEAGAVVAGPKTAIKPSTSAKPTGANLSEVAHIERNGGYLSKIEGATVVQSTDAGVVYELPNLGGVPEITLEAKAGILGELEAEWVAAGNPPVKVAEVLKTSSAYRKLDGVAKLEMTPQKTGKAAMLDGGAPREILGEANVWRSNVHPSELPGWDDLSKARQKAAIKEYNKAAERFEEWLNPEPGSKTARLQECIGQRKRVPLDATPNRAGIQRFVTAEFEELSVVTETAEAKLIRVKYYEIEVVDTRRGVTVNRKTVVDAPEAVPQTPDADAVAIGKVTGTTPAGEPIVEPFTRAEREFFQPRYVDKNIKARRLKPGTKGALPDAAEHGVTLCLDDASAQLAGKLLANYGVPFLPQKVGQNLLKRISPFVAKAGSTPAEIAATYEELLGLVHEAGGFGQHAVVVTSDSRYLGAVPFASW